MPEALFSAVVFRLASPQYCGTASTCSSWACVQQQPQNRPPLFTVGLGILIDHIGPAQKNSPSLTGYPAGHSMCSELVLLATLGVVVHMHRAPVHSNQTAVLSAQSYCKQSAVLSSSLLCAHSRMAACCICKHTMMVITGVQYCAGSAH